MEKSKYKLIIWDWNGTLYRDRDISLATVNYILAKRNRDPITIEQYYSYVDIPITRFYEHLFDLNEVPFEEIGKDYYYAYGLYSAELGLDGPTLDLLRRLHGAGCVQRLVSGYEHGYLCSMVERCGAGDYFTDINGAGNRKAESKLERIGDAVSESGFEKSECVIVGDTEHEFDIASSLGVPCILVGWGHRPAEELRKCGCLFADDTDALSELLLERE